MVVIAVVGISGVGKSTLLRKVNEKIDFLHLPASDVIKREKLRVSESLVNSEELRLGNLNDNQELLIQGFLNEKSQNSITILDGHTVIDTGSELVAIPANVFERMGINEIIFIEADPENILAQRTKDKTRDRPALSIKTIIFHQNEAKRVASEICNEIDLPLRVFNSYDKKHLAQHLLQISKKE